MIFLFFSIFFGTQKLLLQPSVIFSQQIQGNMPLLHAHLEAQPLMELEGDCTDMSGQDPSAREGERSRLARHQTSHRYVQMTLLLANLIMFVWNSKLIYKTVQESMQGMSPVHDAQLFCTLNIILRDLKDLRRIDLLTWKNT